MASSSSSRRPVSDVFRPRFPLDPFADLAQPWTADPDDLPNPSAPRADVILVLGEPTLSDLAPLLGSQQFAHSLVLATATAPLAVPPTAQPAVRVLRLREPLTADSGALRLVRVLEWAERVARAWRLRGGAGVLELAGEDDDDGSAPGPAPPARLARLGAGLRAGAARIQSVPASPAASYTDLRGASPPPASARGRGSLRPRSLSARLFSRPSVPPAPAPAPPGRSFDHIIHLLPAGAAPKAQLRLAILVTTVSRPFLTADGRPQPALNASSASVSSRRTLGIKTTASVASLPLERRADSFYAGMPATPGAGAAPRAHLVHALPAAHPGQGRLAQGLDAFLSALAPGSAHAYAAPVRALGAQIAHTGLSLAELLLWGALDADRAGAGAGAYISGADAVCVPPTRPPRAAPPPRRGAPPTPPDSPGPDAFLAPPPPAAVRHPRHAASVPAPRRPHSTPHAPAGAGVFERALPALPAPVLPAGAAPPHRWGALPTPPESDEDIGVAARPPLARDESYVQVAPGADVPDDRAGSVRRKRWRFWRREAEAEAVH